MNKVILKIIFFTVLAALVSLGCSKDDNNDGSALNNTESGYFVPKDTDTEYCLMCHVSYGTLAEKTAYRTDPLTGVSEARGAGWGNPHDSFHGGPIPCMSCHGDEWMPLASTKTCNDNLGKARLSEACWSCHEPQELYLDKDKHTGWDYTR